jgi:archaellum component FlaC
MLSEIQIQGHPEQIEQLESEVKRLKSVYKKDREMERRT